MVGTRKADTPEHEVRLGAYDDDKQVRLRIAGILDVSAAPYGDRINLLDPNLLSERIAEVFQEFLEDEAFRHLVYIECGPLHSGMFVFSLGGGMS